MENRTSITIKDVCFLQQRYTNATVGKNTNSFYNTGKMKNTSSNIW